MSGAVPLLPIHTSFTLFLPCCQCVDQTSNLSNVSSLRLSLLYDFHFSGVYIPLKFSDKNFAAFTVSSSFRRHPNYISWFRDLPMVCDLGWLTTFRNFFGSIFKCQL